MIPMKQPLIVIDDEYSAKHFSLISNTKEKVMKFDKDTCSFIRFVIFLDEPPMAVEIFQENRFRIPGGKVAGTFGFVISMPSDV